MKVRSRTGPQPLRGTITVPGDKSISHRALILGALARGRSLVAEANSGADVAATAACLRALGIRIESQTAGSIEITGTGGDLAEPSTVLDAGNSGTTLRLLLGICSRVEGMSVLTGDETLRRRPMLRVAAPLREMGARIDGRSHGEFAPMTVRGGNLTGIHKDLPVASAQVKSALLLAGLAAAGTTSVTEPGPSRDHTERMLAAQGVPVTVDERVVTVTGGSAVAPLKMKIPGDVSSAMYLIVAAALIPGSDLTIASVGLNPTRTGALEVLREMGADISWEVTGSEAGEPVGTVSIRASSLRAVRIEGGDLIPRLIDELPILAVAATQAEGETIIADAAELRVKESDRIAALADGLSTLGAPVEARPDGLVITGSRSLQGGTVASHGDHRIALSLAVAGQICAEKVTVEGWSCVDTSFPEFLDLLAQTRAQR